tara:strand:+ start:690 stop:2330 length:1641 start_codon:yes stop_codon:yes gene_type:complete
MIERTWGQHLPDLGIGVGLRRQHFDVVETTDRIPEWFEVLPENFFRFGGRPRSVLRSLKETHPIVSHGVSLNVGGPDPVRQEYLDDLARFFDEVQPKWFTDHLCFSGAHGLEYQDLIPLPFNEEAADHVASRIRQIQSFIGLPFALENPSYYTVMPGSTMHEGAFLRAVTERADCGVLLDVNNVYVNATNHGYDPIRFMESLPLERVIQTHLAGHEVMDDGMLFDTHGTYVPQKVWDLFEWLCQRIGRVPTLIEWDNNIPEWSVLMDEADKASEIMRRALASTETVKPPHESQPISLSTQQKNELEYVSLPDFFEQMGAALEGRRAVDQVTEHFNLNELAQKRIEFYRSMIHHHSTEILTLVYPDTQRALGTELFEQLSEAYVKAHPMRDYEWNATAEAFPRFLASACSEKTFTLAPWSVELAQLEWDWFATYTHREEMPSVNEGLAVNPTLLWHQFQYQVASWMLEKDNGTDPKEGNESVLLFRHPVDMKTKLVPATSERLLVLKMVSENQSVDAVVEQTSADPDFIRTAIEQGLEEGLLLGPAL